MKLDFEKNWVSKENLSNFTKKTFLEMWSNQLERFNENENNFFEKKVFSFLVKKIFLIQDSINFNVAILPS